MPLPIKEQLILVTTSLRNSMEFFVSEEASPEAERRLANNVSNTRVFYERHANAPSPLPYQVEFVKAWEQADCYLRQLHKARMEERLKEGPIGQHSIDRPPLTTIPLPMDMMDLKPPMPPEATVELEEGDDLLPPEDDDQVVSSASTMPTVLKVGLLGFVGYLGYRVIRGK